MTEDFGNLVEEFGNRKEVQPEEIQGKLNAKTLEYAQELAVKSQQAAQMKEQLTELNKRINEIQFSVLPELFREQDITSLSVTSGVKLELTPMYKASIPADWSEEKKQQAFDYLHEHAPELIKTEIILSYDKDQWEAAANVLKWLQQHGIQPQVKENVHHATLTSWVKEQFLRGEKIPFDTLNAKVGSYVKIEREKESKTDTLNLLRQSLALTEQGISENKGK